jgi:hypothetical protein
MSSADALAMIMISRGAYRVRTSIAQAAPSAAELEAQLLKENAGAPLTHSQVLAPLKTLPTRGH